MADADPESTPRIQAIEVPLPNANGIPSPPGTQAVQSNGYPQSDQGDTPPPIVMPRLHREVSPRPPPSPFLYPRTVVNTPQALEHLDLDMPMAPPPAPPTTPSTLTSAIRISATTVEQQAPPVDNTLGLSLQVGTPQPARKPTVFDRLEEVANDHSANGKFTARNSIDKYSLGPMPPIQDASPTSIFDNIHLATIKEWDLLPGGKVIAIPFDSDARFPESHEFLRTRMLTAVTEIISAQEISVAAPKPSDEAANRGRTPTSFLIYNITVDQADTLLKRKVWSSNLTTFRVASFATTCPTFLFTIKGFTTTAMKPVFDMVRSVWDNQETKDCADSLLNNVPADDRTMVNNDIEQLLASMNIHRLDIKVTGNTLLPHFNVYAECSNFTDDKIWTCLRAHLLAATYTSSIQGRATTEKAPFRCSCCHGVDHPRGLCPYPSLPGWNGPKRDSGDALQRRNGNPPYSDNRTQRQRFQPRN